mgnify:CR=1 FL=1
MGARLIPDPLTHFDVEFQLLGDVPNNGTFVAQGLHNDVGSREFQVYTIGGANLSVVIGGDIFVTSQAPSNGIFRFTYDGTTLTTYKNGVVVQATSVPAGINSEATATFTVCTRHAGTNSTYGFRYEGTIANVRIRNSSGNPANSYPINDNSDDIADVVGGQDGVVINGNADDWGLFQQQEDGDWLGQELVTNGGFDTDSVWTKNTGWSIAGGQAIGVDIDASNKTLIQSNVGQVGLNYRISYIGTADTGAFGIQDSGGTVIAGMRITPSINSISKDLIRDTTSLVFKRASSVSNATLDNVSVKELLKVT